MDEDRYVRIAAVGDLHYEPGRGSMADLFSAANRSADILALCGDITTHGRREQVEAFMGDLAGVAIPIVAVFGNHDHEAEITDELMTMLAERGVHVLDGESVVIDDIGFAGVKGFAGGFGRGTLAPFGERLIKDFVQHAIDEALKLENALRTLDTETKVVLMHYSPIEETLEGEPEMIYPFLGTSRLLPPIETHGADVVFHGHAHNGTPEARTPAGIPVYNVALPLLRRTGQQFRIFRARAPERRHRVS
ncbi:MAG TPA: metallophosphoesterase [Longimicrobiales bacterium]